MLACLWVLCVITKNNKQTNSACLFSPSWLWLACVPLRNKRGKKKNHTTPLKQHHIASIDKKAWAVLFMAQSAEIGRLFNRAFHA